MKEIARAIVTFQATNRGVKTDADNPFYHSRYVTLDKIWETIRQDLQILGLAVIQNPYSENGNIGVETIIFHSESGEYISSKFTLPLVKQDAQGGCSCITYARRYALTSMLGLTVDVDDDGNLASGKEKQELTPPKQIVKPTIIDIIKPKENFTPEKVKELDIEMDKIYGDDKTKKSDIKIVCDKCKIPITEKVANYSMEKFKRPLCFDCQKKGDK